ncbi:hypothetical protein NDU88_002367 [Pleurodeles waltl]|uniref:Uncharacterized protein n=1 Tax=Pleurodeles waltl TaxID=8319 RepID=A0AAV7RDK1_PLEWA|nr:hypothetical protein NDU88_002367 [Pleurodeles waltl]
MRWGSRGPCSSLREIPAHCCLTHGRSGARAEGARGGAARDTQRGPAPVTARASVILHHCQHPCPWGNFEEVEQLPMPNRLVSYVPPPPRVPHTYRSSVIPAEDTGVDAVLLAQLAFDSVSDFFKYITRASK